MTDTDKMNSNQLVLTDQFKELSRWSNHRLTIISSGCWVIISTSGKISRYTRTNESYSYHQMTSRKMLHVASIEKFMGLNPNPSNHYILHKCGIPGCCNPAHLFYGTDSDDSRMSAIRKRYHIPKGTVINLSDYQKDDYSINTNGVSLTPKFAYMKWKSLDLYFPHSINQCERSEPESNEREEQLCQSVSRLQEKLDRIGRLQQLHSQEGQEF